MGPRLIKTVLAASALSFRVTPPSPVLPLSLSSLSTILPALCFQCSELVFKVLS